MFSRRESFSEYITRYPIISTLLALNIGIYLLTFIPIFGPGIVNFGIGVNYLVGVGEWWRLVTPMFLHANIMHLLFNMFSLFVFGPELEKIAGKMRFITLYFVSGIVANIATFLLMDMSYIHLGASGAIFGIFGGFGALVYYNRKTLPQLRQIIIPIIVISLVMTFLQTGINRTAHVSGLIAGFLIGLTYFTPKRIFSWQQKRK